MSDWTVDTLKEYVTALMEAQRSDLSHAIKSVEQTAAAALAASEKAVTKAEMATEKRFEGVNEFRGALTDQARNFITKQAMWGYILGAVGMVATVITLTVLFVKK